MSEEEIGQEFDRVIRAAMMGMGQIREHSARVRSAKDQQSREAAQAFVKGQEAQTERIAGMVGRESFWNAATGERIANAATYGATLSHTDPKALSVYETVRDTVWQRYGINTDSIRAQHPGSEDERRKALMHAIDDRIAAQREEALAREARDRAAENDAGASAERREADTELLAGDSDPAPAIEHEKEADRLENRAEDSRADADRHDDARDQYRSTAQTSETNAAAAATRKKANASYPHKANVALTESRRTRQPKGRGGRAAQSTTRPRSSGLSR